MSLLDTAVQVITSDNFINSIAIAFSQLPESRSLKLHIFFSTQNRPDNIPTFLPIFQAVVACNHSYKEIIFRNFIKSIEINSLIQGQLIFNRGPRIYSGERISIFNKWCWEELDSHVQKHEIECLSYTIHKNQLKVD